MPAMPLPADILIVIATLVTALSLASVVAGWASREWPVVALVSLSIGAGLFVYLHLALPGGLGPYDIPDAFIAVAARILN
ncbi:MAG: hypothetical protein ACOCYW_01560 [Roseicyclus sp.]